MCGYAGNFEWMDKTKRQGLVLWRKVCHTHRATHKDSHIHTHTTVHVCRYKLDGVGPTRLWPAGSNYTIMLITAYSGTSGICAFMEVTCCNDLELTRVSTQTLHWGPRTNVHTHTTYTNVHTQPTQTRGQPLEKI